MEDELDEEEDEDFRFEMGGGDTGKLCCLAKTLLLDAIGFVTLEEATVGKLVLLVLALKAV